MTAGRGWIAVALVIFAIWHPARAALGHTFWWSRSPPVEDAGSWYKHTCPVIAYASLSFNHTGPFRHFH